MHYQTAIDESKLIVHPYSHINHINYTCCGSYV